MDNTILETYRIVVLTFSVLDKDDRKKFFEDNFLLANDNPDKELRIPFLIMNNININF